MFGYLFFKPMEIYSNIDRFLSVFYRFQSFLEKKIIKSRKGRQKQGKIMLFVMAVNLESRVEEKSKS